MLCIVPIGSLQCWLAIQRENPQAILYDPLCTAIQNYGVLQSMGKVVILGMVDMDAGMEMETIPVYLFSSDLSCWLNALAFMQDDMMLLLIKMQQGKSKAKKVLVCMQSYE